MLKKSLFVLVFALGASGANAQYVANVNYLSYSDDTFSDVSFGIMTASVGWEYSQEGANITFTPEFRLGTGLEEDSYLGIDFKLSYLYSFNLRTTWEFAPNAYAYVTPGFTKTVMDIGALEDESDFEFGYGLGLGYAIMDNLKLEITMENFDEGETTGFGLRYEF